MYQVCAQKLRHSAMNDMKVASGVKLVSYLRQCRVAGVSRYILE